MGFPDMQGERTSERTWNRWTSRPKSSELSSAARWLDESSSAPAATATAPAESAESAVGLLQALKSLNLGEAVGKFQALGVQELFEVQELEIQDWQRCIALESCWSLLSLSEI